MPWGEPRRPLKTDIILYMAKNDPQNSIPQQVGIVKKPNLGPKLPRQWGVLLLLQAAGYFGQFDRTIFGMAVPQIQSHLTRSNWISRETCVTKLFESEVNPLDRVVAGSHGYLKVQTLWHIGNLIHVVSERQLWNVVSEVILDFLIRRSAMWHLL